MPLTEPRAHPTAVGASRAGFSLIEILVVITIIGLLMGFAALGLGRYREAGREADCRSRIEALTLQVESYADRTGGYPPAMLAGLGVKDANSVNEGIEALAGALRARDYSGTRPDERWLGNGDDDRADGLEAADGSTALLEVLDPWDNPLVYLVHTQYDGAAVYRFGEGSGSEDVDVKAARNRLTGAYHRFDSFQLRSAGPDGIYDTEDDIANYEIEMLQDEG